MKKIRIKSLKLSPLMLFLFIGFGVGYFTNEFLVPVQNQVQQQSYQPVTPLKEETTSVCFTPNKQCQMQILGQINKAKKYIYVQAYSFSDRDIADALVNAAKRGVEVQLLLDKSNRNNKCSAKDVIIKNNLPVRFDAPSGISHNKIMIFDNSIVLTGSYNFSVAAYKRNTENLLILNSSNLAKEYIQNWIKRWEISKEGVNSHRQSSSP